MLESDILVADVGTVVDAGLDAAAEEVLVVNPSAAAIRELVYRLDRRADSPDVKLFVDPDPLKELVDDFLIASSIADLVEDSDLAVRTLDGVLRSSLFLTEEFLFSLVEGGEHVGALSTTDAEFVGTTYDHYASQWRRADAYSLRTPPLSHVRATLAEDIGGAVATDFDRMLDTLEMARGNGQGLDEVTISLLVAATNEELLYDVSRWGEDVGLASKATFSRTKNRLEDHGLIATEKVPIDVGRPRLRLKLGDPELVDASVETLVERATERL